MYLWLRYGKYFNSSYRTFVNACEALEVGENKIYVQNKFAQYNFITRSEKNLTKKSKYKLMYSPSKKFSADVCFIYFSEKEMVIKAEFSPD